MNKQQKLAAIKLANNFCRQPDFLAAKNIALYLASDGEIDPQYIIKKAWQMNKNIYLPVLNPLKPGFLWFVKYSKHTKMQKNIYSISEPAPRFSPKIKNNFLSLVGFPLVAFDSTGARLGMGGGYYDRSFAFAINSRQKPKLIGFAHQLQQVEKLEAESWDITLNAIATDQSFFKITE